MKDDEHKAYHRRLLYTFIVMMLLLFLGATFYHFVEKWSYVDALYFSAATMTTVGYVDITPKTIFGKLFTIVYIFASVAIGLYGLSIIAAHFVEVREEFWLERLGKAKIRRHTKTFLEKLKNLLSYKKEKLTKDYSRYSKK